LVTDIDKAEALAAQFSSVFVSDNGMLPTIGTPRSAVTIGMAEFTPEQVFRSLCLLPNKYSAGPDGIPPVFLKSLAAVFAEPLSIIYNFSMLTSEVPKCWSVAHVIPIYKGKGSTSNV